MDPAPSSSRSASSSSIHTEGSHSADTLTSRSCISTSTAGRRPPPRSQRLTPSRSTLAKPFRSPLKQSPLQGSKESTTAPPPASTQPSSEKVRGHQSSTLSSSIRKQRQTLEARLLMLQQANQCLRDKALTTLPQEIARWREAGQMAAQDLWKMTSADAGDWSGLSSVPPQGDYGLESPTSPFTGASDSHKRKAAESPEASEPPLLARRNRMHSPGAEEQAAALLSIEEPIPQHKGEDSQGARSEASLPELSELLRRSQAVVGAGLVPGRRANLLATREDDRPTCFTVASSDNGIERKWNIGSMLDMLGADKSTLAWDVEEEDFRAPTANTGKAKSN